MNNTVLSTEINISDFNKNQYDNIEESFNNSININEDIKYNIEKVYQRFLENSGKTILNSYNLKYFEMYEILCKNYNNKSELEKLSKYITNTFNDFFTEIDENLFIKNQKDLDLLKYILEISLILMKEVVENSDIELAYEAIFQIRHRIKKEKLFHETYIINYKYDTQEIQLKYNKKHENSIEIRI